VSQRDILAEIADIKSRTRYGSAFTKLWERISAIDIAFEAISPYDSEGLRYFPVAIVGCIEGYTRLRIRDLVDYGEPYFSNGGEMIKNFRLEFSHLKAIHGGAVTVGELIAHNIKLNGLDQVFFNFERLVGSHFKTLLVNATDLWGASEGSQSAILHNPENTFSKVSRTFEIRHIICHELTSAQVNHFEMVSFMEESLRFIRALDSCLSSLLDPGGPNTSLELHSFAVQSLQRSELELEAVLNVLRGGKLRGKALADFDMVHERWQEFVSASVAELVGPRENGGSIWPMEHAFATKDLVDARIQELRRRIRGET
jgi:hypothetical protein